jgi:tetratricopeptide (TPR) repeat protein
LGYYDKAVVGLTKSLQARRALLGPDHALTLRAMWSLAGAYRVTGRRHEALAMSEEIWTRVKAALGADHSETIGALLDFAMAHRQTGKEKQGLVFAEQAYALRKATEGPDARRTMIAMYTMAMLYIDTGQATNAIPLIEQVCEYRKKTHGENSPFTLGSRSALAHAHFVTGQIDRSAALFLDVLDRYRFRLGSQHAKTLEIERYLGRIGDSLKQPGQRQLAKKCFRAHFEHREHLVAAAIKNRESRFADMYRFQTVFVELLKSDGRNPEADGVVREGAAFWEKVAAEHPDLAELQHVSAQNHQAAGNAKRAVELARKAVALAPKNPAFLNTLGIAQYRNSDWNGALATLTTSVDSRKGGDAFDWFFLAMANWQLGKKDDARKWHDQAVAWMDKHQPKNAELRRFRAEAAKLLGIDKKKD